MALRKDRGPLVDNSIGILGCVVGIALTENMIGYLGDVRRVLGVVLLVIWILR